MQEVRLSEHQEILGTGAWVVMVLLLVALFGFVLLFVTAP